MNKLIQIAFFWVKVPFPKTHLIWTPFFKEIAVDIHPSSNSALLLEASLRISWASKRSRWPPPGNSHFFHRRKRNIIFELALLQGICDRSQEGIHPFFLFSKCCGSYIAATCFGTNKPIIKAASWNCCWENCLQHDHRIVLCMEANGIIWNSCTYGWIFLVDIYPMGSFNKTPPPIGREVLSCIFLSLPLCFLDASWKTLAAGSKVHVQCLQVSH